MCDVPSIAVFCSESIECFPGTAFKFFLKILVTIPVAPTITGKIVHFRFHIRCISIHKLLYFNFFSASFCTTFLSAGIATSIIIILILIIFIIILKFIFLLGGGILVSPDLNRRSERFSPALTECCVQCLLVRSSVALWPTGDLRALKVLIQFLLKYS